MPRAPIRSLRDDAQASLGQFFTPLWAAEELVDTYFGDLSPEDDFVIEPSCGDGAFLRALPPEIPALGVEIDPAHAERARRVTGRPVIAGDFRTCDLETEATRHGVRPWRLRPTAVIGNPPFDLGVFDGFLERAYGLLPAGGRVGMIVPAYFMQTAARVVGYAERWGIAQDMIPRNIFPGLEKPLLFVLMTKDRTRSLVGFALYHEAASVKELDRAYQDIVASQRTAAGARSIWASAVSEAIAACGGRAGLDAIYREMEGRRPSSTGWWREKVRQTLQRYFSRGDDGFWTAGRAGLEAA